VKLGDENTSFFHVVATIRNRKNSISYLSNVEGILVYSHDAKADLIWNDFKDRLGSTCWDQMFFDLDSLLQDTIDLSTLEAPFSQQEIDSVVKQLPLDKSLGPDGFSNEFLKMCWPIIRHDFYKLCAAFCDENVCL
jgi:hypothetical protein